MFALYSYAVGVWWRIRLLAALLVLFAALAGLPVSGVVRADIVPGIGRLPFYHFSLDRTPITVEFVLRRGGRDFPQLTIPRAYIYFANNHTNRSYPSKNGPLPDRVETDDLNIAFAEPDGEPWSIAVDMLARKKSISRASAAAEMRPLLYKAQLLPSGGPKIAEYIRQDVRRRFRLRSETYEGRVLYQQTGTGVMYLGTERDEFISASCYQPAHPRYYCKYSMLVSNDFVARIDFLDFRHHGGLEYANRRLRFARELICRFLEKC